MFPVSTVARGGWQFLSIGVQFDDLVAAFFQRLLNLRLVADEQDLPVVMERDMGGDNLKFLYLDGRAKFGHYLEYTWMTDAQWDQIRAA